MNGYPKETYHNNVMEILTVKLMTTNSCQCMNGEKKYTVIMAFIDQPSIPMYGMVFCF